ncbi:MULTISPECIES: DUF4810 domain-containing protein [unclassified Caballeronia]|jgi:hypothetical protein|uniref:DUF4810 domain-containing protein n=1 Tax=unclassified Caballeronia TaxID=2646786 RepID=UPI0020288A43|nr:MULTISPECIES: DUF4810 domain-containing protein [unclassified Caballeronia]MDR5770209.1 DUF4810 domain-containing protein [Caballeronia sp. LZ002]MDR5845646.1 DUF4810 domain-containing protein [Caballeronia sp. LZ003]
MNHKKLFSTGILLPVAAACALLTGCATQSTPPLYQWDAYQPQVYAFFTGDKSVPEQIDALEKARQQILAKNNALPPGFRAHIGALYASVGRSDEARKELEAEKNAFPESSAYMNLLLSKLH